MSCVGDDTHSWSPHCTCTSIHPGHARSPSHIMLLVLGFRTTIDLTGSWASSPMPSLTLAGLR